MVKRWFILNWIPLAFCCWGLLHLLFFWGKGFTIYLSPWFRWIALAAGIVLVLLALLWPFLPTNDCEETKCHSHHHHRKTFWQFGIIIFPVLLCLWVRPSEFSVTTLQNRGVSSELLPGMDTISTEELFTEPNFDFAEDLSSGQLSEISVSDLLFIADDPELREKFQSKTIQVVGQPIFSSASRFQLTRLFIMCCAADARPVGFWVESESEVPVSLQKKNWLEVEGKLEFKSETNRFVPWIQASQVKETQAPEEIFLY